jgi:DNA-binding response OmpR family regulator
VDAVILDMRLAGGDFGGELAVELAMTPDGPTVILLSASTELALPIAQVHGLAWIQKPFEFERLVSVLRVSFEMRGRRRLQQRPRPLADVIDLASARRSK